MIKIVRLQVKDDEALLLHTTYIPSESAPGLTKEKVKGGIHQLLHDLFNQQIANTKEIIAIHHLSQEEASLLYQESGEAVLSSTQKSRNTKDEIVELTYILGDPEKQK